MTESKTIRLFPSGMVTPPPSKSLSHRALICAALAAWTAPRHQNSTIESLGISQDVAATLNALAVMGTEFIPTDNGIIAVAGRTAALPEIDCAESGSTLRFLIPIAALGNTAYRFTGRGRLLQRPLDAYLRLFCQGGEHLGVQLALAENSLTVCGPMRAGRLPLSGDVSSQFVSGLLLALPLLAEDSEIILQTPLESRAYVDLTLEVMQQFGARAEPTPAGYRIAGGQRYRPTDYHVEADYSQAAFFLAAAALGCPVACAGLNPESKQGDRAMLDILRGMGAQVAWRDNLTRISARELRATTIDAREIPDLVPVLAALLCFAGGESRIVNAQRLRYKESDRLHAICTELQKLGGNVRQTPDGLLIHGQAALHGGATVDAHGDHRIAMALAVSAIRCRNPVTLTGYQSVAKSYPNFWQDFEKEALTWRQAGDTN